jgi:SAM-dependent methyltransferase
MTDDHAEISDARAYYRKIIRFYRKESVSRAHLDFWRTLARRLRPARILELGSGLGRITAELSRVAPSFGIDVSIEMLLEAQRPDRARFVAADARRAAFGPVFDLIVAPGDPFSHLTTLEDRRRALRAVARQLTPNGRFVLEGLHRKRHETAFPQRRIRYAEGVLEIDESWFPFGMSDLWHARYRYRDRRRDGSEERLSAAFLARAWNRGTIRAEFEACGLRMVSIWGDFDGRPVRADAKRIIVIAGPGARGYRRRDSSSRVA